MFLGKYLTHLIQRKDFSSFEISKALGRVVVVTHGLDHCLYLYSRKAWEKEAQTYAAEVNGIATRRGLARLFLAGSFEVEIDKTGRVLIPENLKSFASLTEKAVITGVADRVEVWEENAWKNILRRLSAMLMPMLKSLAPVLKISMEARHESILMSEVLTALDIQPSDTVVDATIGGAGHFSALLAALGGKGSSSVLMPTPRRSSAGARPTHATVGRTDRSRI